MNPNRQHQRAKHFRSLDRELKKLWQKKCNTPKVKLDKPFQRGWERFFVLTEPAKRRGDTVRLAQALEYFQNYQRCRKGYFYRNSYQNVRPFRVREHYLRRPHLTQIIKKGIPRRLLHYIKTRSIDLDKGLPTIRQLERRQLGERVSFRYPLLVKSHTQPHIITHLPLHDPELEARIEEIETFLWQTGPRGEINKAHHRRNWRWCEPTKHQQSSREDLKHQLQAANHDPTIRSAISPRFFSALIPIMQRSPFHISLHSRTRTQLMNSIQLYWSFSCLFELP